MCHPAGGTRKFLFDITPTNLPYWKGGPGLHVAFPLASSKGPWSLPYKTSRHQDVALRNRRPRMPSHRFNYENGVEGAVVAFENPFTIVMRNFKPTNAPANRHHTVAHVPDDGEHLINMV